ncbi:MAG: hypothetical protein JWM99_31 [Verrucomicrobiales bacterium]|jgi:hypothetical protein|nr:hypothetical protein [Verrucomicrobiales bacterium]
MGQRLESHNHGDLCVQAKAVPKWGRLLSVLKAFTAGNRAEVHSLDGFRILACHYNPVAQ